MVAESKDANSKTSTSIFSGADALMSLLDAEIQRAVAAERKEADQRLADFQRLAANDKAASEDHIRNLIVRIQELEITLDTALQAIEDRNKQMYV